MGDYWEVGLSSATKVIGRRTVRVLVQSRVEGVFVFVMVDYRGRDSRLRIQILLQKFEDLSLLGLEKENE